MWVLVASLLAVGGVGAAVVAAVTASRRGHEARQARASAQAYRAVLDHALVGIAVLGPAAEPTGRRVWRVQDANPALGNLLCRDVAGADWPALVTPDDVEATARTLDALADGRLAAWHGEHALDVAGRGRSVHVSMAPLPVVAGTPRRVAVQVVDVTDKVSEQMRLRDLALHDALTGLPNRTLLADRLELALAGTRRSGGRVLVAFCDLDDFKTVNDTAGHAAGDEVLVTVADRLRDAVRPADTVARVGGDEFVVLCPDVPDETVAAQIAGRLLGALRTPVVLDGVTCHSGGSVGVALSAPARRTDSSALLQAADVAMYRAKRGGKSAAHLLMLADDEDVFLDAVVDVRTPDGVAPTPAPDGMPHRPLPAPRRSA